MGDASFICCGGGPTLGFAAAVGGATLGRVTRMNFSGRLAASVGNEVSSAVEHFAVEYIDDGFAVTIRAVGELDMAAAGLLSAEFDRAMESSAGDVTVNLSAVTFMDSTGLSALLRAHAALVALGRRLVVDAPAPAATRISS